MDRPAFRNANAGVLHYGYRFNRDNGLRPQYARYAVEERIDAPLPLFHEALNARTRGPDRLIQQVTNPHWPQVLSWFNRGMKWAHLEGGNVGYTDGSASWVPNTDVDVPGNGGDRDDNASWPPNSPWSRYEHTAGSLRFGLDYVLTSRPDWVN